MQLLYWLAFTSYSIIVVGLGVYVYRKRRHGQEGDDTQSFWAADRNLSGWSTGLSISAGMMSISWSCVYGVQLFYWYGAGAVWLLLIPWLLTLLGFFIFAPLFRKFDTFTQPELLGKRFGPRSRLVLAPPLIFVFIVWAGAEIYAAGITIAPFLGIPLPATLFLIALVVALYSFTGGFEAVVSTDKIQFALVALFISIMAWIGISSLDANQTWTSLLEASTLAPRAQEGAHGLWAPGLALIALTFCAYLPGWIVETDIWIRLQAAKSNREARKGILVAGVNAFLFIGLCPLLIGLSTLLLYPPVDGIAPDVLQDGSLIFAALMRDYAPDGLNIILGIGLVAAAMSTVDTCGNVVALSFSYDVLEPYLKSKKSKSDLIYLARWSSVGAIFLAFVYALFTESLWDIFYLSSGILTTAVFIPVVASFLPSTTATQIHSATFCGFFGILLFYVLESWGALINLEPAWFAETEVGYIFLGLLCSVLGFFTAKIAPHRFHE